MNFNMDNRAETRSEYAPAATTQNTQNQHSNRNLIIGLVIGGIVLLAALAGAIYYLALPSTPTEKIRDIFIIFLALEFLLIGVALVILIIQLATLTNLLQNEVKPILKSTTEAANTIKGTAVFLSENLTQPVVKLGGYAAGMKRLFEIVNIARKK
jgi:flagellar basal body-associated protein FliL